MSLPFLFTCFGLGFETGLAAAKVINMNAVMTRSALTIFLGELAVSVSLFIRPTSASFRRVFLFLQNAHRNNGITIMKGVRVSQM